MLILRIRQAEVAADAGRLDEAFELATRDGGRFRSHRRGQEAITRIIAAFARRGREHLSAGRLIQAGADCERAGRLGGGGLPEITQLTADLRDAQLGRQLVQRDAALAVATARRFVDDGALSMGRRVLAGVADDSRAKRLMTDIDDHRARLDAALAAATAAAERGDWATAAGAVARGRAIAPADVRLAGQADVVADALSQAARKHFDAGRLDLATDTAEHLRLADPDSITARDLTRALEHCHIAITNIDQSRPHDAAERLRRVGILFPNTGWIDNTLKQVEAAADAIDQLRAGPLSLAADARTNATTIAPRTPRAARPAVRSPGPNQVGVHPANPSALPDRFILQVDGAGAFLVVRSAIVKVGPISSTALPDVALVADATAPAVSIERLEDDYFLRASSLVALNDKPVTDGLLSSGDRIGLSPRCRFTFALPHAASTTGVLDLVGARYPRGDVRRVILMDRDIVLGPGPSSHVRVGGLVAPVVLNFRNAMLRPSVEATVGGTPLGREEGIPMGVAVVAAGASLVLSRV